MQSDLDLDHLTALDAGTVLSLKLMFLLFYISILCVVL